MEILFSVRANNPRIIPPKGLMMSIRVILCLLLFIMALSPYAAAADAMFRANPQHTGIFDNGGIVSTNNELWRFATGGSVDSSPSVSNGVVYVGSDDNNLYAFDAVTGKELWRFATGSIVSSSPAVSNGVVYIISNDKNLYAIDSVTGKERWRFATGSIMAGSSPAVSNGVVYVGSEDNNLYAIDVATGTAKWRFATGARVRSSPAVLNGVVYVGSADNYLYAIDAVMGTKKWRYPMKGIVSSSPAVSNGVVYVGSEDNNLYAIDVATGTAKWRFATGARVRSSPAVSNDVVYVGSDDTNLYAIDAVTGTEKWQFKTGFCVQSSPAVSNSVVYVGSEDNNLYAIYAVSGKERWRFTTGGYVDSSPSVSNGIVYVGSQDKNLYAVGGTPAQLAYVQSLSQSNSGSSDSSGSIILIIEIIVGIVAVGYIVYSLIFRSKKGKPQSPQKASAPKFNQPVTPKQLPPELSDRYTEFELIGKGGFARVFKAKRKDGQYVALKIPISLDASTGKTFMAELQNWTKLDHPNIVRVFDCNIMPLPYFEMELCDGSLAEAKKPMDCEEAAWIVFHVCEGLKYAHARSIAHRDLKPQNILIKDDIPKISDWGLSKIISESTSTTSGAFTLYYAAPEQVNNKPKDERTDIWQLGVILYELTTGTLPFKGDSIGEIAVNILTKPYTRPSELNPTTREIEQIIGLCLEKDPDKRFPSVTALQKALGLYLRQNYAELFKQSVTTHDIRRSAHYVGDLIIVNLIIGDLTAAYKYSTDLVEYAKGDAKALAHEFCDQLYIRIQNNVTEVPDELIKKAEYVVHKVLMGF